MSGDISFRTAMWAEKQIWKINFRFCTTAEVLDEQETGSKQRMCDESEMGCVCVCVWQKKGGDSGNLYIHARYSIISFLALSLLLCNAEIFMSWKKNQQNDRCALIPTKWSEKKRANTTTRKW